jgi:arylsulfatase A-like enzyme
MVRRPNRWQRAPHQAAVAAAVGMLVGIVVLLLGGFGVLLGSGVDKTTTSILLGFLATPSRLWLQVAGFVVAFLTVHIAFAVAVFHLPRPALALVTSDKARLLRLQLLVALLATLSAILLNARIYPNSAYGDGVAALMDSAVAVFLAGGLSFFVAATVVAGVAMRLRNFLIGGTIQLRPTGGVVSLGLVVAASVVGGATLMGNAPPERTTFPDRPHVLLIGVDGWRLDTAPFTGGEPGLMPFMDSIFTEAAVIAEAYTPHARTYPAWLTILTGREPPDHGARFNLIADEHVELGETLVDLLGELGYHSLFAMDERRFANLGTHHGFDLVVGPPLGAADFLLGAWGDSPLTNLVVNTSVGRILFPFSHGNRGVAGTYRPATFDRAVAEALRAAPDKPIFLAVHFELPHWPYVWGERPTRLFSDDPVRGPAAYLATLARVDEQVRELFRSLDREGFLEHAVIAVFSDHGESFGSPGVGFTNTRTGQLRQELYGHGSDVMSLSQYRVPMAFLRTGPTGRITPGVRPIRGSLKDLFPTVADWVGFEVPVGVTGLSLARELDSPGGDSWERPLALETGFTLSSLLGPNLHQRRLLDEGSVYYDLRPDGRLTLRDDRLHELIAKKQRAVLLGNWMLAVIPAAEGDSAPRLLLADLESERYVDLSEGDLPGAPAGDLLRHFCERFRGEVDLRLPVPLPAWARSVGADSLC